MFVGLSGLAHTLDQARVLARGGTDSQLIESQHGTSGLDDASACSLSDTQGTDLFSVYI